MPAPNRNVFINCPFDAEYRLCFEGLVFAIMASGYTVRCALEEDDAANIRMDKLCRLIAASPRSIHDLSRTELGANDLPRFNMPFELGLVIGAKRFGTPAMKRKRTAAIMVRAPYVLPAYLSDLGGNDPAAHHGNPEQVMRIVRQYLHKDPRGRALPGPQHYIAGFRKFKEDLPGMAAAAHWGAGELDPIAHYRDYVTFLTAYRQAAKQAPAD